ncbi:MAG: SMI1/KNR4 family protein [Candidatus Sericytochromatia bacterium]
MKLKMKEANPPAKMEDIENYQKKHNIKLPQDYIEFLLENDGVESTEWMFYNTKTYTWEQTLIDEFLSVQRLENCAECFDDDDIHHTIYTLKKMGAIIIASNDSAEFSIGIEEHNFGHIFISNFLEDDEIIKIADNFTEFINGFEYEE